VRKDLPGSTAPPPTGGKAAAVITLLGPTMEEEEESGEEEKEGVRGGTRSDSTTGKEEGEDPEAEYSFSSSPSGWRPSRKHVPTEGKSARGSGKEEAYASSTGFSWPHPSRRCSRSGA